MTIQIKRQAKFRQVGSDAEKFLFIAETFADLYRSTELLTEKDLRPLTRREAFFFSRELITELKDNHFWLADTVRDILPPVNYLGLKPEAS